MKIFLMTSRARTLVILLSVWMLHACTSSSTFKHKDNIKASRYNAQLGINYLNKNKDLEYARLKLEKALKQDESNALAHAGYAQLQSLVGNNEQAEIHYQNAIELEPLNANHQNAYGVFLCENGQIDKSVAVFDDAVSNRYYKTPEYALDNAGVCLLGTGDTKQAEHYFAKAIKHNPKYAPALLNSADLNLQANRLELANAYYMRYNKRAKESARSLWLGYRIMQAMGKHDTAKALSDKMLRQYPESKQTGELLLKTANEQ